MSSHAVPLESVYQGDYVLRRYVSGYGVRRSGDQPGAVECVDQRAHRVADAFGTEERQLRLRAYAAPYRDATAQHFSVVQAVYLGLERLLHFQSEFVQIVHDRAYVAA